MKLNLFKIDPRLRIAFVLATIWLIYLFLHFDFRALILPLFSVCLVSILDLSVTYARKKQFHLPYSSFVTGFLIGIIISPNENFLVFVTACMFAVFSKQFIRVGERQHIFNPAAFGIIAASVLLEAPAAWWAVSWTWWIIILIISVSYTLFKLKRLWLPLTFLASYFIFLLLRFPPEEAFKLIVDGSVFLFAFVMLPEPMTSPVGGHFKYFWGPMVALLVAVLSLLMIFDELFLPALLVANLIGFTSTRFLKLGKAQFGHVKIG